MSETTIAMRVQGVNRGAIGQYLVLIDEKAERFLPIGLRWSTGEAVRLQLNVGQFGVSAAPFEAMVKFLGMEVTRLEIVDLPEPVPQTGWIAGRAVVQQDGNESYLPLRPHEAAVLAHVRGLPVQVSPGALARVGLSADETGGGCERLDYENLFRLAAGFEALGRPDDGIPVVRRLMDLRDWWDSGWRANLGGMYRQKGWLVAAAEEYFRAIEWNRKWGYTGNALELARRLAEIDFAGIAPLTVVAPGMVDDFASPHFNHERMGEGEVVAAPNRPGEKAYRLRYDLAKESGPWLATTLLGTQAWKGARAVTFEIFHETGPAGPLPVRFGIDLGGAHTGKVGTMVQAPAGWSRHRLALGEANWQARTRDGLVAGSVPSALTSEEMATVTWYSFVVEGQGRQGSGALSFANIRIE